MIRVAFARVKPHKIERLESWLRELMSRQDEVRETFVQETPGELAIYKTRYSGFYRTELDSVLQERGIKHLLVTGCTTSVCVESTIRDAMFRDYHCLLLADGTAEPIGSSFSRTNHDASLLVIQTLFGSVSESADVVRALQHAAMPHTTLHPAAP